MERIENIHQIQSCKVQEKTDQTSMGVRILDEETMDFQIDDSIRLDH